MAKTISTGMVSKTVNGMKINTSYPCNSDNYTNCSSRSVSYVVMHYSGNSKDTAINNCKYFQTSGRNASAHFFVDDTSIYQSVELRDRAWHCGTSGTYYHSSCRNANSISIEMCCTAGNYKISDTTIDNAAYLCAYVCELLGITSSTVDTYVLRHYDVTHKNCPAQMVSSSSAWTSFKTKVKNVLKTGNVDGTTTSSSSSSTSSSSSSSSYTSSKTATTAAQSYSKSLAGTYTVNASSGLNMRDAPSTGSVMVALPNGTSVQCYGYYTTVSGVKWLYVQVVYNKVKYTGFCSKTYLKSA